MRRVLVSSLIIFALLLTPLTVHAGGPGVVRAVLFWMEGCGHCHVVINDVLPPLKAKYGDRLDVILIQVKDAQSEERWLKAAQAMGYDPTMIGVPFMIIGNRVLMGSLQIPRELPGLIEQYLAQGGVDLPQIPGLEDLRSASSKPAIASIKSGFSLAWLVMVVLVLSALYAVWGLVRLYVQRSVPVGPSWLSALVPILCLAGLVVAAYLSYVETTATKAMCGPVGDCNAVQASAYARIYGVLPVAVLGFLGYVAILAAWLLARWRKGALLGYAAPAMFAMALFGVLYSIYLTYLELFVIKAVCSWCLTSAAIMAALLVLSTGPATNAVAKD